MVKLKGLRQAISDYRRMYNRLELGYVTILLNRSTGQLWASSLTQSKGEVWRMRHDVAVCDMLKWAVVRENIRPTLARITMKNLKAWANNALFSWDNFLND